MNTLVEINFELSGNKKILNNHCDHDFYRLNYTIIVQSHMVAKFEC